MPSTCPHGNPIPGMPAPEAHQPFPLSLAKTDQALVVDRITEEAEADRQLLRFLWDTGVRPGSRLIVGEVAPYAGTITVMLDNRSVQVVLRDAQAAQLEGSGHGASVGDKARLC